MILAAVTDMHGSTAALDALGAALAAADLVLLTGDLTNFGHEADAAAVVDAVRTHNAAVLAVFGNCDYPDVDDYLQGEDMDLHGRCRVVGGVGFVGLGGSLPCPGRTPGEFSEGELARLLERAGKELPVGMPWVLVSHQPPYGTAVDVVRSGQHVGSHAVRRFIEEHEPLACFSGHIHEAAGIDNIGPTRLANPGPMHMGHYTHAEIIDGKLAMLEIR